MSSANDIGFITAAMTGREQFRATGTGAMSETLTANENLVILSTALHLSAAGGATENFVAKVDADAGVAYDTVLISQDMAATTDIYDNEPRYIAAGDDIDFTYANTNGRTWGLTVQYGKVGT